MRGVPIILRKGICRDTGFPVEEHQRQAPFDWQSPTFWVARPDPYAVFNIGTGDTKAEAVAAMLRKNSHLEVRHAA